MKVDPGLVVMVGAVLIFYLRLIGLQRERAKRAQPPPESKGKGSGRRPGAGQKHPRPAVSLEQYSILSPRRSDRIIAGVGALLLLLGAAMYAGVLPLEVLKPYWWVPSAVGIIAFSWAFKV